jgi:serine/threonine protein kinase
VSIFRENEDEDFIEELLSTYTPIRLLGTGAFSYVYAAEDHYGNEVAIKVSKVTYSSIGFR